jgi:hypothetical protein
MNYDGFLEFLETYPVVLFLVYLGLDFWENHLH